MLANDTTAPDAGETLTVTAVTQPANGTVTLHGLQRTFHPDGQLQRHHDVHYTISDGNGGTDTATVTVTVTPVNDPPDAVNDTFTVAEDSGATPLDVLANDSTAPDIGETLTVTAVTQPADGTVTLVGGVVSFTPAAGFNGTTTFNYTVSDGTGTDTATVTVTVTPVNDPPTANDDSFTVAEDSAATTFNVLANDSTAPDVGRDADHHRGDAAGGGHGDLHGHQRQLHPGGQLRGHRDVHLHGVRRQRWHGDGDGDGDGQPGERSARRGERQPHGGRGQRQQHAERAGQRHAWRRTWARR